jgi:hypothetical protein
MTIVLEYYSTSVQKYILPLSAEFVNNYSQAQMKKYAAKFTVIFNRGA